MEEHPGTGNIEVKNGFVMVATMTVEYEGRASSKLQQGNYLLLKKPDGSVSIHGGDLNKPLNYQGAGSRMYQQGWTLTVFSKDGSEKMVVEVIEVLNLYRPKEWSDHKIRIVRTERELRDDLADSIGQYIPNVVSVHKEFPTEHGPIDLVVIDADGVYHTFEIKRQVISINAIVQLRRYMEVLAHEVRGYVAAPTIRENAIRYADKHSISFIKVDHKQT